MEDGVDDDSCFSLVNACNAEEHVDESPRSLTHLGRLSITFDDIQLLKKVSKQHFVEHCNVAFSTITAVQRLHALGPEARASRRLWARGGDRITSTSTGKYVSK